MADLFERLFPDSEIENIAAHAFHAALVDYGAGHTTRAEIIAHWELDAEAQADLTVLCDSIDGMTALQKVAFALELHAVMLIAGEGAKYTTKAEFKTRLGL